MARVPLDIQARAIGPTGAIRVETGAPAEIYVYLRGTKTQANVYNARSGGTVVAQPLRPDSEGKYPYWVSPGNYDIYSPNDRETVEWAAIDPDEIAQVGDLLSVLNPFNDGRLLEVGGDGSLEPVDAPRAIGARVTNENPTGVSMQHGVTTLARYDTVELDTHGFFDEANTDRLTAPIKGLYVVTGCFEFSASGTGDRQVSLAKNTGTALTYHRVNAAASGNTDLSISTIVDLDVGDYVQMTGIQGSGGAMDIWACNLEIALVGRL